MAKNKLEQARAYVKLGDDLIAGYRYWKKQSGFLKHKLALLASSDTSDISNAMMVTFVQGTGIEDTFIELPLKNLGTLSKDLYNMIKQMLESKYKEAIKSMESDRDRLARDYDINVNDL